ncbi:type IV conjugative transfer system coupling protein TraD [Neisseria sp. Ec49-e6-T10]|uniref:type IV conjugative transfer system coupling protein TraD n=1 Tax=Neisseria sp. Ec49-e6-T10 TaxID=3140744 RepID=UPI003EBB662B
MSSPENVYRPPYEWVSVCTIMVAIYPLLYFPMPPNLTMICLSILGVLLLWRSKQAIRIMRFRKSLRKLPYYGLTANEVPVSDKAMFLGLGFRWTQEHTQRLFFARQPENRHLLDSSRLYKWAREYEINHKGQNQLTKLTRSSKWWNPVAPLPPVGGSPEIHGVEIHERNIWSDLGERVGHTAVIGTTRVGKTRLAETLVIQDIHRGDVTIFFDPKGDADMLIRMYVESAKANRPFYMFHLGFPEFSCRYNPIGDFGRITEVATRIANQLPGEGQSAAFKEFVWRYINVLTKTMEALSIKPTYVDIYRFASNVDEIAKEYFELKLNKADPNWAEKYEAFLAEDDSPTLKSIKQQANKAGRNLDTMMLANFIKAENHSDDIIDALMTILSNDRSYFEKLVSSLYPLLEKLTTGDVSELISPRPDNLDDQRPLMDWRKVIESDAVVYIGLDALSDFEVAAAVGNAMFADLTSLAGQIYKHGSGYGQSVQANKRKVAIHADEFNELIGDEFIPLLNKAGGAGYQVTVYTQTWSDVEAKIGSSAKAAQIGGNLNTLIMLRVKSPETAEMLTNQLPQVKIQNSTLVSGANDVAFPDSHEDFGSRNEDRIGAEAVPMLEPADLVALPKGQAFALIEGGQLYKIRMPLPEKDPTEEVPEHIQDIAAKMKDKSRLSETLEVQEHAFIEGEHYGQ